jgi:3-dehydroquinate dehydratase-2
MEEPLASRTITILNGPNLNLLGQRQPEIYGATTLADIEHMCRQKAASFGYNVDFQQSNHEGALVEFIHAARQTAAGIIINPAAYTHTSVAILDALLASDLPVIEVHLSNIHKREHFRQHSYVSSMAHGVICGFGAFGYSMAIDAMHQILHDMA